MLSARCLKMVIPQQLLELIRNFAILWMQSNLRKAFIKQLIEDGFNVAVYHFAEVEMGVQILKKRRGVIEKMLKLILIKLYRKDDCAGSAQPYSSGFQQQKCKARDVLLSAYKYVLNPKNTSTTK